MSDDDQTSRLAAKGQGDAFFEKGNAAYDAGQYERALEMFDKAIESGIASEIVYNNRGAALDALGRNADAVESYTKATSSDPSYELAWHNLGNSLYMQEAFGMAAQSYAKAASLKPDRKENWSGLAASYGKLGKARKAKPAIARLGKFETEDSLILLVQADLYLEAGLLAEALEKCEQFVAKHPESPLGYSHRGNVEHEMGVFGKAIDTFEKAAQVSPNDKEVWNNMGYTYFVAGYLDKATECFDKAISIDPRYKHAWYNKGYAYHGADMLEQAVECYRKAIELDSHDKVLWNNLGNALYNLGRYGESIPKFVEAIRVDPDYEIAWNNIGNAMEKMDRHGEAIAYHDRSLEISPDFDYALYAKGVCEAVCGSHDEGYDLVLESLDLNPSYDEAWKARAEIAGQLGRWDEALMAIDEALGLNPEYDQGWVERGEILLAVGDYEASQASFEMALKCLDTIRSDTSGGLFAIMRRGEVLQRMGRFDEALANFESVVVSGKLNSASIVRVLAVRRLLCRWDLPRAVRQAAETAPEPDVKLEYAKFLVDAGELASAERMLSLVADVLGTGAEFALVKARLASAKGAPSVPSGPELSGASGPLASAAFVAEAEARESNKEFEEAARLYSSAIAASPSDARAAIGLARCRLALGSHKSALILADRAIGMDLRDWEPHIIKAEAFKALGDKESAEREREHAKAIAGKAGMTLGEIAGEGPK